MTSELVAILEKEAAAEIERLLAEARTQAEQITASAQKDAQAYLDSQRQRLDAERRAARTRAHSAAQVRASALVLRAKDSALTEVYAAAEAELARLEKDKRRYAAVLRGLIKEAAGGLSGRITVEVHPGDDEIAGQAVRDLKLDAEVKTSNGISGGALLSSHDGRFLVENTLASRLERVKPMLAPEVAALLWG